MLMSTKISCSELLNDVPEDIPTIGKFVKAGDAWVRLVAFAKIVGIRRLMTKYKEVLRPARLGVCLILR